MAERTPAVGGLVVRVAGSRWFIPVAGVIEVLRDALIVRVPGAVPAVRGSWLWWRPRDVALPWRSTVSWN